MEEKAMSGVIKRFRFMAFAAGVMSSLLWFVELPVVYVIKDPELTSKVKWIPFVHGYVYPFYVLTAIHLCVKARYSVPKMIAFILAGTLPIASFVAERKVARSLQ